MAIYHLHTSVGSRKGGQSAAAKHDYIHREGRYSRDPEEVAHAESGNMPGWARDDPRLYWEAADAHERANGRLFRELEFSLPVELTHEQRVAAARRFAERVAGGREKLPYSLAVHRGESGDPRKPDNPHCHLVVSERVNDGLERSAEQWFRRWNRKSPEQGGARKTPATHTRGWLFDIRLEWADIANKALREAGREERIHDGTLEEQFWDVAEAMDWPDEKTPEMEDLERRPGIHVGPAGRAMEARGERSDRGEIQRAIESETRAWRVVSALERWMDITRRLLDVGRAIQRRLAARKAPRSRIEALERERERIEKLYEDARKTGGWSSQIRMEREAREAERRLERRIRKLPWSERRELERRERSRSTGWSR